MQAAHNVFVMEVPQHVTTLARFENLRCLSLLHTELLQHEEVRLTNEMSDRLWCFIKPQLCERRWNDRNAAPKLMQCSVGHRHSVQKFMHKTLFIMAVHAWVSGPGYLWMLMPM